LVAFSGLGFAGFACPGGTAGVAGVAGRGAGGCADCAGTAGTALACEPRVFTLVLGAGLAVPPPFEVGGAGAAEAAEAVGACAAEADVPDGVLPPPTVGWPGTGVPGTGAPGAGGPGDAGTPPPPPPAGATAGTPPESGPEPFEAKIGMKPANGDGETVGRAMSGRAGSTSAGTLRSCVPGTASSRIAERSSTDRACIHSWADATAPAASAPT
jgi:hypothetical protein